MKSVFVAAHNMLFSAVFLLLKIVCTFSLGPRIGYKEISFLAVVDNAFSLWFRIVKKKASLSKVDAELDILDI